MVIKDIVMKKIVILAIVAIGIFILNSCKDQYEFSMDKVSTNFEQETDLAFPLVNASMTLEEILPDDEDVNRYLIIENDGFIVKFIKYSIGFIDKIIGNAARNLLIKNKRIASCEHGSQIFNYLIIRFC